MSAAAGWGTVAEKRFLDGLGRHSINPPARAELLRGYLAALPRRYRWGSLDRYAIERYATVLLGMDPEEGARHG